ncbi:unnamed protein product [Mesocestoides corti]|uniref:Uncharacterized protein n=1 Tax=Mesocestoides corti TaxID=53468 RepID=A0A158QVL2_MESCO|nr:unnamed protein product [Mesocestoides corti]
MRGMEGCLRAFGGRQQGGEIIASCDRLVYLQPHNTVIIKHMEFDPRGCTNSFSRSQSFSTTAWSTFLSLDSLTGTKPAGSLHTPVLLRDPSAVFQSASLFPSEVSPSGVICEGSSSLASGRGNLFELANFTYGRSSRRSPELAPSETRRQPREMTEVPCVTTSSLEDEGGVLPITRA